MDLEVELGGEGEDRVERCEFGNWRECFVEIDTLDLGEALGDNMCLILLYSAVGSAFNAEYPLGPHYVFATQLWHNFVHPHALKSMHLLLTGNFPFCSIWAGHGLSIGAWVNFIKLS